MQFLYLLLYVIATPVVLYFSSKMVTYGFLSAKQLFAEQQKKKQLGLNTAPTNNQ